MAIFWIHDCLGHSFSLGLTIDWKTGVDLPCRLNLPRITILSVLDTWDGAA
jgi:hypothetical protein